jgi:PAS domain-containing protein
VKTKIVTSENIVSFAAIPIKSGGKLFAVMNIASHRHHHFTAEDVDLYKAITSIIGTYIYNARLYQDVQYELNERKHAEEALQESYNYLERLTNSMGDAVFSVKMPERVIDWVNDGFEVFGYDADECVGKTTVFLYPYKSEFLDFGNKLKKAIAAGKKILYTEQFNIKKNGDSCSLRQTER